MPIGATQLGWYFYDQQTGFDFGMIVGVSTVIYAAWLMYEKGWREEMKISTNQYIKELWKK